MMLRKNAVFNSRRSKIYFRGSLAVSKKTFTDVPEEDQEILQLFSFIFMLGYDVYVKKLLLEKLVDNFQDATQKQEPEKGKPTKEKSTKEKTVKEK